MSQLVRAGALLSGVEGSETEAHVARPNLGGVGAGRTNADAAVARSSPTARRHEGEVRVGDEVASDGGSGEARVAVWRVRGAMCCGVAFTGEVGGFYSRSSGGERRMPGDAWRSPVVPGDATGR